jgi:hypothetical protein
MKNITALFIAAATTLTFVASANAMVQTPGTFVPAQCGAQTYNGPNLDIQGDRNITQVCLGSIAGEDLGTKAVQFRMNDGTAHVFKVSSMSNLFIGFMNTSDYSNFSSMYYLVNENGERTTMKVAQDGGQIEAAAGTLQGIRYLIPKFEVVFTVQDASL